MSRLQAGDLVVGEPVMLEVPGSNQKFKLDIKYLDARTVYLSQPVDENKQPVTLDSGTEVKVIVTGFGRRFDYDTKVIGTEDRDPPRIMVERTTPVEFIANRASLRMNVSIQTKVEVLKADGSVAKAIKGELLDISAGGGRLRVTEELKRDTDLHVNFPLQGAENIDTPVKVVRAFPPTRRGVFEVALSFTGENPEALGDHVAKWIMDQQRRRTLR